MGKEKCDNKMDKREFVTFTLVNVKRPVTHRSDIADCFAGQCSHITQ